MRLCHFPLLLLRLLACCLSEEAVPLEEVEVFLQFAALGLIECELLLGRGDIALLEVDGIDVVDSDDGQQKYADVLRIDLVLFQGLVGLVDEGAL